MNHSFKKIRPATAKASISFALTIVMSLSAHGQTVTQSATNPNQLTSAAPLPPNYKTIFENPDLLVMHVHYGAHEFVPMHDHPAVATMFVYLNDSGEVDITHEGPNAFTAQRPPTHTGAFRIAPAMAERHSVTSHSDTDSEFLRVELKRIPPDDIKKVFRGEVPDTLIPRSEAPTTLIPSNNTEFEDRAIRVERIVCGADCVVHSLLNRSLLIAITPSSIDNEKLNPGDVRFFPALKKGDKLHMSHLSPNGQFLRVSLLYPE